MAQLFQAQLCRSVQTDVSTRQNRLSKALQGRLCSTHHRKTVLPCGVKQILLVLPLHAFWALQAGVGSLRTAHLPFAVVGAVFRVQACLPLLRAAHEIFLSPSSFAVLFLLLSLPHLHLCFASLPNSPILAMDGMHPSRLLHMQEPSEDGTHEASPQHQPVRRVTGSNSEPLGQQQHINSNSAHEQQLPGPSSSDSGLPDQPPSGPAAMAPAFAQDHTSDVSARIQPLSQQRPLPETPVCVLTQTLFRLFS